jgi:isopentenyl diphosphate isomerase/L-lactate dehydrogenase-like FMN-dependent dehydrogenase
VPATIDVLPEIVDEVAGAVDVLVDGGVRRGTDVLTALALGARAVMVGRPALWGLAAGGAGGALRALELLRREIALALILAGCASPDQVTPEHVRPAARPAR